MSVANVKEFIASFSSAMGGMQKTEVKRIKKEKEKNLKGEDRSIRNVRRSSSKILRH